MIIYTVLNDESETNALLLAIAIAYNLLGYSL